MTEENMKDAEYNARGIVSLFQELGLDHAVCKYILALQDQIERMESRTKAENFADVFAQEMHARKVTNFIEYRATTGEGEDIVVHVQRVAGKTPGRLLEEEKAKREVMCWQVSVSSMPMDHIHACQLLASFGLAPEGALLMNTAEVLANLPPVSKTPASAHEMVRILRESGMVLTYEPVPFPDGDMVKRVP